MNHSIRIQIPQGLHEEPIIFRLVAEYHLQVNIKAAVMGKDGVGGSWFELDLQGEPDNVQTALTDLRALGLSIWEGDADEGWTLAPGS